MSEFEPTPQAWNVTWSRIDPGLPLIETDSGLAVPIGPTNGESPLRIPLSCIETPEVFEIGGDPRLMAGVIEMSPDDENGNSAVIRAFDPEVDTGALVLAHAVAHQQLPRKVSATVHYLAADGSYMKKFLNRRWRFSPYSALSMSSLVHLNGQGEHLNLRYANLTKKLMGPHTRKPHDIWYKDGEIEVTQGMGSRRERLKR